MKVIILALILAGVTPAFAQDGSSMIPIRIMNDPTPIADRALELAAALPREAVMAQEDSHTDGWLFWLTNIGYGVCVVADALTSGWAKGAGTGTEGNPIYQDVQEFPLRFGVRRGLLAALTPTANWLLHKKGGKTGRLVGNLITGGAGVAYCGVAYSNGEIAIGDQ